MTLLTAVPDVREVGISMDLLTSNKHTRDLLDVVRELLEFVGRYSYQVTDVNELPFHVALRKSPNAMKYDLKCSCALVIRYLYVVRLCWTSVTGLTARNYRTTSL